MIKRSPRDGKPFYCALCVLGFGEFLVCEESDCALESIEAAHKRSNRRPVKVRTPKLAAWAQRIVDGKVRETR